MILPQEESILPSFQLFLLVKGLEGTINGRVVLSEVISVSMAFHGMLAGSSISIPSINYWQRLDHTSAMGAGNGEIHFCIFLLPIVPLLAPWPCWALVPPFSRHALPFCEDRYSRSLAFEDYFIVSLILFTAWELYTCHENNVMEQRVIQYYIITHNFNLHIFIVKVHVARAHTNLERQEQCIDVSLVAKSLGLYIHSTHLLHQPTSYDQKDLPC